MSGPLLKIAEAIDLSLSEDGQVTVAFAVLGDPTNQKAEEIDKDGDVSLVGSIPVGQEVAISSYAHASWPERGGRLPVGRGVLSEGKAKGKNLGILTGGFFTDTTHGRDTYLTVKGLGSLQQWSFGYAVESSKSTWAGLPANINKKYDVFEVSPVLVGAGNGTHTMGIKEGEDPLAGISLESHFNRVLGEVEAVKARILEVADLRAKEGRVLSTANRERITALLSALGGMDDFRQELANLLESTDPDRIASEGKALELAFLESSARIHTLLHA